MLKLRIIRLVSDRPSTNTPKVEQTLKINSLFKHDWQTYGIKNRQVMYNGLATTPARQSEAARLGLKAKYTPSLRSRFLWQFPNEYLKEIFNKE